MNAVGIPEQARTKPGSLLPAGTVARNITLKFASELAARAIQFGFIVVAARQLGARGFGVYSFAAAFGFVLAQSSDLGLQLYVARELARTPDRGPQILGSALRCKAVLFAGSLLLLLGFVRLQAEVPDRGLVFLLALAVMMTSPLEFFNYAFRGYRRLEFEAGINLTARLLGPGVAIPALLSGAPLLTVSWILLIANAAAAWLGYFWLTRRFARPAWNADNSELRRAIRQVFPLGLAILLSAAYTRTGVLMLSRMASLDAAGWFNAAHRLTDPLSVLPAIAMAAVFPAFSSRSDTGEQAALARRTLAGLFAAALAIVPAGWLGARLVIAVLYGPGFIPSVAALRWLALAVAPVFLNYALGHFIIARGRPWFNVLFNAAILVENFGLNLWLIPRLGAQGAALSLLASELSLLALSLVGYRRAMVIE